MSAISDIFDAIHTQVSAVLTTHAELQNPYFLERDSQITLAQSYGIRIGPGVNLLGNEGSGAEQRQQDYTLVLTRRKFATKGNITARKSVEKLLFEDQALVLEKIVQEPKLGISVVQRVLYVDHSGVQFLPLDSDRNDIYFLETVLQVDYEQDVTLCV